MNFIGEKINRNEGMTLDMREINRREVLKRKERWKANALYETDQSFDSDVSDFMYIDLEDLYTIAATTNRLLYGTY